MEKAEDKSYMNEVLQQLSWIEPPGDDSVIYENRFDQLKRMACTVLALTIGIKEFLNGNSVRSQLMMRYRIGMQGFTVFSLCAGLWYEYYLKTNEKKDS